MINNPDSWNISQEERTKHDSQFISLKPVNGFITGEQAKTFFVKSALPTQILGQIWGLADLDKDGRMDKKEFSIAMFLIKKKLEGCQLPVSLPAGLKHDPLTNTNSASMHPGGYSTLPGSGPVFSTSFGGGNNVAYAQNGSFSSFPPTGQGQVSSGVVARGGFPLINQAYPSPTAPPPPSHGVDDWSSLQQARPRFRLQFNQNDRHKRGYLTGVEARAILLQSGLPQPVLAQIWNLADIDRDGNLTFDEFCIAMHLIDLAKSGAALPSSLPPSIVSSAYQMRRDSGSASMVAANMGGTSGVASPSMPLSSSASSSVGAGSSEHAVEEPKQPVMTIEDKRLENFKKGQAELEKRQALLREQMQKEEDARMAKERAEQEKKEKIRLEKERLRQAEIDRQMERQRQIEAEREEQRQRARRETERQRLLEVEKKRMETALHEKNREQANLEQAQTHQANLREELINMETKRIDIESLINGSISSVDQYKDGIADMRGQRDHYDQGMREVESRVEAAKAELNHWQSEREKLSLLLQTSAEGDPVTEQYKAIRANLEAKRTSTEDLKKQIGTLENDMTKKGQELASKRNRVQDFDKKLQRLVNDVNGLQTTATEKMNQWKPNASNDWKTNNTNATRPKDSFSDLFAGFKEKDSTTLGSILRVEAVEWPDNKTSTWGTSSGNTAEAKSYANALYDFEARQSDELSFNAGDMIKLMPDSGNASGWLTGQLNGKTGIFPEDYVRVCGPPTTASKLPSVGASLFSTDLSTASSSSSYMPVTNNKKNNVADELTAEDGEVYETFNNSFRGEETNNDVWVEALYPWEGQAGTEFTFPSGAHIRVLEEQGEWWSGQIEDRVGWFPRSYVRTLPASGAAGDNGASALRSAAPANKTAPAASANIRTDEELVAGDTEVYEMIDSFVPPPQAAGSGGGGATAHRPSIQEDAEFCVALYQYDSGESGDLVLRARDIIKIERIEQDWWEGSIVGTERRGLFPANFVRKMKVKEMEASGIDVSNVRNLLESVPSQSNWSTTSSNNKTNNSTAGSTTMSGGASAASLKHSEEPLPDNEDVYDNLPSGGDISEPPSGTAEVTALTNNQLRSSPAVSTPETTRVAGGSKLEIAQVIVPYTASGVEQLSLVTGQLIQIRKRSATGWWEGELQQRGQKRRIGWFPADYVRVMNSVPEGSASGSPRPGSSHSRTQGLSSSAFRNKSGSATLPATPSAAAAPASEQVCAIYSYSAQNVDELTFEKGAVITVVSKDEPEWWRGRLANGTEGLFPVNYIRRIQATAKTSSSEAAADSDDGLHFDVVLTDNEKKRQYYIKELIDTEKAYYNDLREVHQVFYKPFSESEHLPKDELAKIFVNWTDLMPKSFNFYMALKIRRNNCGLNQPIQCIGDILIGNFPNFMNYVRFCSCQNQSLSIFQKRINSSTKFKDLCLKCEQNTRCKMMPFSSFLLKPMQRITKYKLIVENILRYTDTYHPDRSDMEEATAAARSLCEAVNEGVREKENSERLEWLQEHVQCDGLNEKLYFNSRTNCLGHRRLLRSGTLYKVKSNREVVVFMFNDFLLLATPTYNTGGTPFIFPSEATSKSKMNFKMYKKPIFLNSIMLSPGVQGQHLSEAAPDIFTVSEPNLIQSFKALSTNDRDRWLELLQSASSEYLETEKSEKMRSLTINRSVGIGRLLVTVMEGINLKAGNIGGDGKSDPYCEVSLGSQMHKTKVVSSTLNPKWNASMQFQFKNVEQDVLCLTVYDKDYFAPNDFLGRVEFRLTDIAKEKKNCPGPLEKKLKLMEVETGEIVIKLDLHFFDTVTD